MSIFECNVNSNLITKRTYAYIYIYIHAFENGLVCKSVCKGVSKFVLETFTKGMQSGTVYK